MGCLYKPYISIDLGEAIRTLNPNDRKELRYDVFLDNYPYPDERISGIKDAAEVTLGNYGVIKLIIELFNLLDTDDKQNVKGQILSILNKAKE